MLAGVAGGSIGAEGRMCVCWGTQMLQANLLGRGGGKLVVTVCANIRGRGQAWERVCVAVPSVCCKVCVRVAGGPESHRAGWGLHQDKEPHLHSSAAVNCKPARRWGQRCVCARPGGAVKWDSQRTYAGEQQQHGTQEAEGREVEV